MSYGVLECDIVVLQNYRLWFCNKIFYNKKVALFVLDPMCIYKFQEYIITRYLYTLHSVYHNKSSSQPAPHNWSPSTISPPPQYPSPPVNTNLYLWMYFLYLFIFLASTYKWYHTIFVLVRLTFFTWHNTLKVHPCCCKWQFSCLWLSSIPFYVCACLYHIFFNHLLLVGHLGYCHILIL